MGNKIIYNGEEYNGTIVNDNGVGEFVSNSGQKMDTGNNEIFNSYDGANKNQINGTASNSTVLGSNNVLGNANSTINNSVLGGYDNNIQGDTRNSLIYGSRIIGTIGHINESVIFGNPTFTGTGAQIEQSLIAGSGVGENLHVHESLMINGSGNIDVESSIISGQNTLGSSSLRAHIHSSIIGGVNNIQPINNNSIAGSLIVGNNSIAGYGTESSIIGGGQNTISGTLCGCDESLIVGLGNEFSDIEASIMGGKRNKINNVSGSLVLGADNKTLGTYTHQNAVFLGSAGICGPSATNFHIEGQGDSSTHTNDKINAFLGETSEHTWSYYLDHSHKYSMQEPPISNMCGDISGHVEGEKTAIYRGIGAHSEGNRTMTIGTGSHSEGYGTAIIGEGAHIEGTYNEAASFVTGNVGTYEISGNATSERLNNNKWGTDNYYTYSSVSNGGNAGAHIEGQNNFTLSSNSTHVENENNLIIQMPSSHIEGQSNIGYQGSVNHIEGYNNLSLMIPGGQSSVDTNTAKTHIEGLYNKAVGQNGTHMEGHYQIAYRGDFNHLEGGRGLIFGDGNLISNYNHIEGCGNNSISDFSEYTIIGAPDLIANTSVSYLNSSVDVINTYPFANTITGAYNHLEGYMTSIQNSNYCHAEGSSIIDTTNKKLYHQSINNSSHSSHVEGGGNFITDGASYSHAEGMKNTISGGSAVGHVEGQNNTLTNGSTVGHVEGQNNTLTKGSFCGHVEGSDNTIDFGTYSHIEGYNNTISSSTNYSHVEGCTNNIINGSSYSHAEGYNNIITNGSSYGHIEGISNIIKDNSPYSHAEGSSNVVESAQYTHIEGSFNTTTGSFYCHVEGDHNIINNGSSYSHAEGRYNSIKNWSYEDSSQVVHSYTSQNAHTEGYQNISMGEASHTQGIGNRTQGIAQTALGMYNDYDKTAIDSNQKGTYAITVGNGSATPTQIVTYDNTATYAIDDQVIYEDKAYKCITAVTEAENFDSTKWEELNIELIDGKEITRSNAMTLSWNGYLDVSGGFSVNGIPIGTGGSGDIANPNISDAYSNSAIYNVGDYCIYQDTLYKCNTAITAAEAWTASHWTATTVGAELLAIISRVSALENQLNGFTIHSAMTQAQYDVLTVKDPNTLYPIVG